LQPTVFVFKAQEWLRRSVSYPLPAGLKGSLPLQPAYITGSVSDRLDCEDGGGRSSDTRIVPDRASDPGRR